jgi:hypothetical protein
MENGFSLHSTALLEAALPSGNNGRTVQRTAQQFIDARSSVGLGKVALYAMANRWFQASV